MKAVFFSDAHLNRNDQERIGLIGRFVGEISEDADIVVIAGDLFEFYHGYDDFIYPWFRPIADMLKRTASLKTVYFVEGNHEFRMGDYFQSYTGVQCRDTLVLDLDGKRVLVSHGDNRGGNFLRFLLKSPFIYSVMSLFGPRLTWSTAMGCRLFLSRKKKIYDRRVLDKFRSYGLERLRNGYDAIVLAHSHMPDILSFEEEGREKTYLNTGDLIKNYTYGEYTSDGGFKLKRWDGSATRRDAQSSRSPTAQ
jgi:UDP-2,3-diacylglucosamine hydrolase